MKWRYGNTNDSFSVDIGSFISDRNILLADITSAIYMVKAERSDPDANALVTLTIGSGITKVPAVGSEPDKLALKFTDADFGTGALEAPSASCSTKAYYTGIGIKTTSMTKYLEAGFVDDRLTVFSDFIHD